ncbi:unnamed protein product, partial [Prorocentrum cordatum]
MLNMQGPTPDQTRSAMTMRAPASNPSSSQNERAGTSVTTNTLENPSCKPKSSNLEPPTEHTEQRRNRRGQEGAGTSPATNGAVPRAPCSLHCPARERERERERENRRRARGGGEKKGRAFSEGSELPGPSE